MSRAYTRRWTSVAEIRAANAAGGGFFFSRDTMRFFAGRVHGFVGPRFVLHSTKSGFADPRRQFHVAVVGDHGDVDNVGPSEGWETLRDARAYAKALAAAGVVPMRHGLPDTFETRAGAMAGLSRTAGSGEAVRP